MKIDPWFVSIILLCVTCGCVTKPQEASTVASPDNVQIHPENPKSPDKKGTEQYNMELVRQGQPPIPILLTREEIDQLIKDGELSPRSDWE